MSMNIEDAFRKAWVKVGLEYADGAICSERHMQAVLYSELKKSLVVMLCDVHIEPSIEGINMDTLKGKIPDILISYNNKIVAVIELKYTPTSFPPYKKDVDTLCSFRKHSGSDAIIYLKTDPKTGEWNTFEEFKIARDITLIHAVLAKRGAEALDPGKKDCGIITIGNAV